MRSFAAAVLCLAAVMSAPLARPQAVTGSISGTVTDSTGAVIAGASVSVLNQEQKSVLRTVTTNSDGGFSIPQLPPATYTVTAQNAGFKKSQQSDLRLNVNDALTVNLTLNVGDTAETITVESTPLQVELQQGSVQSTTINGSQVRELALVTRNYEQLVALMPGVSSASVDQLYVGTSLPSGQTATIPFAINGARNSMNAWLVDGADNVDRGSNQTLLNTPSIDAIMQFKVLRSGYSAEAGRAGGAQISVVTKSGTSQFHGDAYEFVRNSAFAANNFINNANRVNLGSDGKAQVAPLHYNNFGWTLGGPLYIPHVYNTDKNKTFFFVSQEFRRVITYANGTSVVPQSGWLNGTFNTPVCLAYTGSACTNASTQVTNINPVARQYVQDIFSKLPLSATSTSLTTLFRNVYNFEQELYKVDHNFGSKLQVSARFLRDQIPTTEPQGLFTGSPVPGVAVTNTNAPGHNWTLRATSAFTPTFLNEAGYSYSYGAIISDPTGLINSNISPDIKANLPFSPTISQVPWLTFTGGSSILGFGPYRDYNRNHNFYDNVTKIVGNHSFKFGGTFNHYQKTENAGGANAGSFNFTSATAGTPAGTTLFAQSFANFLTGNVQTFTQASLDLTPDIRANQWELYALDDWRVTPRLTVNVGVRYSMFRQPYDANNLLTTFDPSLYNAANAPAVTAGGLLTSNAQNYLNGISINGSTSPYGNKVSNEDSHNIAPRIGFAWDPFGDGKTSVRGGYGIFYDSVLYGIFEQNIFNNPPYVNSVSISNVTLDNPAGGTAAISTTPKAIRGTMPEYKSPYMQQWSFEIQRQFTPSTLLSVAYVGTKGTHLLGIVDINQVYPNFAYTSGFTPSSTFYTSSGGELPLNNLRPYKGYNAINVVEPWFNSNYNSLQVYATKRLRGDSQVNVSYTWSKNMTNNQTDRSSAPQNSYDFKSEYGPASFDRTHVFNVNFIYELPFFREQRGIVGKALGGWQLSMIGQYYTGLPLTVTTSNSDPAALGLLGSSAASARPDVVCDPYANFNSTRQSWFNTGCFVNPTGHTVGNAGRGLLRGPGYEGWSASMAKNIRFGAEQRFRFQLRGEASNVFNHSNPSAFGSLNNTSALFGQITGYRDPRIIQLGAKFYF